MIDFSQKIDEIDNKEDFVDFVKLLVSNLKDNPEEWANINLSDYLESISSWTEDMEGYYQNNDIPIPKSINWKAFANILVAAKMYEQIEMLLIPSSAECSMKIKKVKSCAQSLTAYLKQKTSDWRSSL